MPPSRVNMTHDSYYNDANATPRRSPACGPPNLLEYWYVPDVNTSSSPKDPPRPNGDERHAAGQGGGARDGTVADAAPGAAFH